MKIPVQDKIAELERRIVALESRAGAPTRTVVAHNTVDVEPEMSRVWAAFHALFAKVRKLS